jgi:hypothetical protein
VDTVRSLSGSAYERAAQYISRLPTPHLQIETGSSLTAHTLPSDPIQFTVQGHDPQVAEMVFEKVAVVDIGGFLERVDLFEDKIVHFTS